MRHEQQNSSDWVEIVREKVRTLQFGVVQIVVHDSRVTQIERTERTRLNSGVSVDALKTPSEA
ncbi:MAG: hypothetical protein DLM52_06155 [Chthoniobacterales bacterium]|nr:MAG: hypothetical protein DLM52_06155 [Chthoniobacterales bacterium]